METTWNFCPACGWQVQQFYATIRKHVFEAIVRHAIRGGAWKQSCVAPMRHNKITVDEVEAEVRRRANAMKATRAAAAARGRLKKGDPPIRKKLSDIRGALNRVTRKSNAPVIGELASVIDELEQCLSELEEQVETARKLRKDGRSMQDIDSESGSARRRRSAG
jgi:hypothetical protein